MIAFFLKGLLRDRSRSLFPTLTVFAGVFLSVLLYSYMNGVIAEMLRSTAHFQTGHLRVMTRAYSREVDQSPNDFAFIGVDQLIRSLRAETPDMIWTPRIKYRDKQAQSIAAAFNAKYETSDDRFAPRMGALPQESGLADYLEIMDSAALIIVAVFILAMSIVLWNAGLMGSLRRYGEIGVRLAIGEDKGHVYRSLIAEVVLIGVFGSILGTLAGVAVAYWMQVYGIDISFMLKNASLMMSDVLRAQVTLGSFLIGFIPGILATVLGAAIAGIGIFKRETSQLFKELEV